MNILKSKAENINRKHYEWFVLLILLLLHMELKSNLVKMMFTG